MHDTDNGNDLVLRSKEYLPSRSNGKQCNSKLKWDIADSEHVVIRDIPPSGIPPSGLLIPKSQLTILGTFLLTNI